MVVSGGDVGAEGVGVERKRERAGRRGVRVVSGVRGMEGGWQAEGLFGCLTVPLGVLSGVVESLGSDPTPLLSHGTEATHSTLLNYFSLSL